MNKKVEFNLGEMRGGLTTLFVFFMIVYEIPRPLANLGVYSKERKELPEGRTEGRVAWRGGKREFEKWQTPLTFHLSGQGSLYPRDVLFSVCFMSCIVFAPSQETGQT